MSRLGAIAWLSLGAMLWIGSAEAATIQVKMTKLAFEPAEVQAQVGDTIEWVNQDFIPHTATANGREWDVVVQKNQTGSIKVTKAGTVDYFCRFHPNMKAKIVVRE